MKPGTARVLVVDDEPEVVDVLCTLLASEGYDTTPAYRGSEALEAITADGFAVVVTDLGMPDVDGMTVLNHAKAHDHTAEVIVVTGRDDVHTAVQCMKAGAFDFVTKPFQLDAVASVVHSAANKARTEAENRQLRGAISAIKRALMLSLQARDSYTHGHCLNVAILARRFCAHLDLDESVLEAVSAVGELHDVGKIGIADFILLKPSKLTPAEYAIMQTHPAQGRDILDPMGAFGVESELVLHHHERWDGAGYPIGLKGEEIPLVARVFALADVFDALTSSRPYRRAMPYETAIEVIHNGWGTQFQPDITDEFLSFIGAFVGLSSPRDVGEAFERARHEEEG